MAATDSTEALRAELAAARAENEVLLQQITRLCLYIETQTGQDPIAVMYARDPTVLTAPPRPPAESDRSPLATPYAIGGWLYRKLVGPSGDRAAAPSRPPPPHHPHPTPSSSSSSSSSFAPPERASRQPPPPAAAAAAAAPGGADDAAASTPLPIDSLVERSTFEWLGDPEAIDGLEAAMMAAGAVAGCRLSGNGFTRLPSSRAVWARLSPTLVSLCLNGNSLVELPAAIAQLRALRRLELEGDPHAHAHAHAHVHTHAHPHPHPEPGDPPPPRARRLQSPSTSRSCSPSPGNLLRSLPSPIVELTNLEELGVGCNQLSGLPDELGHTNPTCEAPPELEPQPSSSSSSSPCTLPLTLA